MMTVTPHVGCYHGDMKTHDLDNVQPGWVDLSLVILDADLLDGSRSSRQAVVALRRLGHRVHLIAVEGETWLDIEADGLQVDGVHRAGGEVEHAELLGALRPGMALSRQPRRLHAACFIPDRVVVGNVAPGTGCLDESLSVTDDLCGWLRKWGGDRAAKALALAGATADNVVALTGRRRVRHIASL